MIKQNLEEKIKKAASALLNAEAVLITAGAGMGVDSGLPDFRGNEGFWKSYPPIAKLGISFVGMADPRWFTTNPKLAWAFYGHRLNLYRRTEPHDGHKTLLEIVKNKKYGYFIYTSNVDGQFIKAGFDENRIAECHGSIHYLQCHNRCNNDIWSADGINVNVNEELFEAHEPFPKCPNCGAIARPNILMFGDWDWLSRRTEEQEERMEQWLHSVKNVRIAIIEFGAGTSVPTVRYKSETVYNFEPSDLIRINPIDYDVPSGAISIPLESKEGIDRIAKAMLDC